MPSINTMYVSSSPSCVLASIESLGRFKDIVPSSVELIITINPKISGSTTISLTVPPLMVYSTSKVPEFPASTSKILVVSGLSFFVEKSKVVSEISPP